MVVLDREENRREDAEALTEAGLDLFVSDVTTLSAAVQVVHDLATLTGMPPGRTIVPAVDPLGLSVFVPIWRRPWMSISQCTYGASVLEHLGCTLVTGHLRAAYPEVSLDDVGEWCPDVVAVPSEPYTFIDDHLGELGAASPTSRVIRIDGQDLFWWGVRTPGAISRLAGVLAHASGSG